MFQHIGDALILNVSLFFFYHVGKTLYFYPFLLYDHASMQLSNVKLCTQITFRRP